MENNCLPIIKRIVLYPFYWLIVWAFVGITNSLFSLDKDGAMIATIGFFALVVSEAIESLLVSLKEMYHGRKSKD